MLKPSTIGRTSLLVLALVAGCVPVSGLATETVWTGTSGSWSQPRNWSNGYPTAASDVRITGTGFTTEVDARFDVRDLIVRTGQHERVPFHSRDASTLDIGYFLTVNGLFSSEGAVNVRGTLKLATSQVISTGLMTITGILELASPSVRMNSDIALNGLVA